MASPTSQPTPTTPPPTFPSRPYKPTHPTFPYTPLDFRRQDESDDTDFYSQPRFVTHIDDNAIALLRQYYASTLPRKGRILDLCSSWISHFPPELEELAIAGKEKKQKRQSPGNEDGKNENDEEALEVIGLGLNAKELSHNPILTTSLLQNLNLTPTLPPSLSPLTATTCVVSIDYLTHPLPVLTSLHHLTKQGGTIHLVISNRCFPTKAVGRWLRVSEEERLEMVGDYLWWSGWRDVEVVEVCDGRGGGRRGGLMGLWGGGVDPLWVVRGVKVGETEGGEE